MRFLDAMRDRGVETLQVYLTPLEAERLRRSLEFLLEAPEEWRHDHVHAEDGLREMSLSLVTPSKMSQLERYSEVEQQVLTEDRPAL